MKLHKIVFLCLLATACSKNGALLRSSGDYEETQAGGVYKIGNPYQIDGVWYYPKEENDYRQRGQASWYKDDFSGSWLTANGEQFDPSLMTGAHKTLPLPSVVQVTNLENGKTAIIRINDRGPFVEDRILDVSQTAANVLGFENQGTTPVEIKLLPEETRLVKEELISQNRISLDTTTQDSLKGISSTVPSVAHTQVAEVTMEKAETKYNNKTTAGTYIQVGAFSNPDNAYRLAQSLKNFGNVSVEQTGSLHKVLVGPTSNPDILLEKIQDAGYFDAMVKNIM